MQDAHGWQPISTAPRDGAFLVWGFTHQGGWQVFKAMRSGGVLRSAGSWWHIHERTDPPPMWQPLPAPPQDREEAPGD